MPAGEFARHALPGHSAREQSAGATRAGRALTTTEGGGGMPPSVRGGGGRASLREGPPVRLTHAPSLAAGGGARAPVRDRSGMGGWWEGPPVRGSAGPRLPLLLPLPRNRGGGVLPV